MKNVSLTFSVVMLICIACKDEDLPIVFESECYPIGLRSGVLASYDFSNGSLENGTTFKADLNPNQGPVPAADRFGNPGCAYAFDSKPYFPFLSTSNTSFLNGLKEFSISLWYQPPDSSVGSDLEVLVSRNKSQEVCDRVGEWSVGLHACRRAVFTLNNTVWENIALPPEGCHELIYMLTGSWHHVVAVYNNDHYKLYKDGILQDSTSGLGSCQGIPLAEDVGDLILGYGFTGKLDDILIYNREISPAEVAELFALQPCCQQ